MTIEFRCATCAKTLRVGSEAAGKKARCPECGTIQDVPPAFPGSATTASAADAGTPVIGGGALSSGRVVGTESPFALAAAESSPNPFADRAPFGMSGSETTSPYAAASQVSGAAMPQWTDSHSSYRLFAEQRVKAPALAMMIVQGIILCMVLFQVLVVAVQGMNQGDWEIAVFQLGGIGLSAAMSAVIFFGAWNMYRVQAHGLALAAAVLSMLPCTGCCLLSLPIGIWALVVLNDPVVKQGFQTNA